MNWAWASSLDHVWRSPVFPTWLTLAAAGFFGVVLLITLLRADKSVANGALTVITLLAIGVAVAAVFRGAVPAGGGGTTLAEAPPPPQAGPALPALACVDDMAGETVLTACEKVLFGSAESAASAVSYAAAQVTRLTAFGDVAAANRSITPELQGLRHSIERDRYGLVAYVLLTRDHCTPADCAAFRSLTDRNQIVAHMDERVYDGLITRYAASWNAPPAPVPTAGLIAGLPASLPTGKPTNAEFPSAASTPAVSIMSPEPGQAAPRPPASPRPAPPAASAAPGQAAAKKPPKPRAAAPVQIAPAAQAPASAPAASNE